MSLKSGIFSLFIALLENSGIFESILLKIEIIEFLFTDLNLDISIEQDRKCPRDMAKLLFHLVWSSSSPRSELSSRDKNRSSFQILQSGLQQVFEWNLLLKIEIKELQLYFRLLGWFLCVSVTLINGHKMPKFTLKSVVYKRDDPIKAQLRVINAFFFCQIYDVS